MVLQDIFDQLTLGELSKIKLGGSKNTSRAIAVEDYPVVIPAINQAINALHTRLPLRTNSVTVELYGHITYYILHSDFAESNTASTQPTKYISDSIYFPFKDTVISVEKVRDSGGHELPINDYNNLNSVFLPNHNTVQYPYPTTGYTMDVIYREGLPKIPVDVADPSTHIIDIPDYAMQALLANVKSRLTAGLSRQDNVQESYASLAQFEGHCIEIERQSLIVSTTYANTRIQDRGWQ